MGSIYRPAYKDRKGKKRQSSIWWIQYYAHGRKIREATDTTDFSEAKDILKQKEADTTKGRMTKTVERKVLFSELTELVTKDYELNGYRSATDTGTRLRLHLLPHFGKMKAIRINETDIDNYILIRRDEGASNGTINRELSTIKRAFNLGIQKRIVSDKPYISLLQEAVPRQGFFEREQYKAIRKHLPAWVKPVTDFAFITGWRRSEILGLQWKQVDFEAGNIRLDSDQTKNREARQFPFTSKLRVVLERQKTIHDDLARKGKISPWVFPYKRGEKLGDFKHSWHTACRKAGLPGKLIHDFRRTAVRNLVRAGIPERVAMKMTGHKTRSVFERYNIVSEGDLREAAARLEAFSGRDNPIVNIIK